RGIQQGGLDAPDDGRHREGAGHLPLTRRAQPCTNLNWPLTNMPPVLTNVRFRDNVSECLLLTQSGYRPANSRTGKDCLTPRPPLTSGRAKLRRGRKPFIQLL